ncbi:steroid 17-alpha-hydroxylase/17,20 lyase-like [Gadus macrocephalus]|uniref:steroid 17-alpha-hydroxylase/17,20 lyase-like n=1 Tax=Gadus macrocephalus TaxID=80720 RepID=UPI0028CB2F17|nr:steroid 17-alpha-hydroxylase/17,20 lyase-like [Gadus macrocephalus]
MLVSSDPSLPSPWLAAMVTALVVLLAWRWLAPDPPQQQGPMPCLPHLPLLGSLPWLRAHLPPHLLFTQLSRRYGPLYSFYLGPHYTVVINSLPHVKEVLLAERKGLRRPPLHVFDSS